MKLFQSTITAAAIAATALGATAAEKKECKKCPTFGEGLLKPASKIVLPDEFNSPDGMTLGKDGRIYLSINNVGDQSHPAKVGVIDNNDKVTVFSDLPAHPETGKVSPLGIVFGSDGNLYIADNQAFVTEEAGKSRLLRVNIKDGKAVGTEVLVTGMTMANGVTAHGDYVVVNDTAIDKTYPLKSGTYRFAIKEFTGKPIAVKGLDDPHLVLKLETKNKDHQVGANGVTCDKRGNLYVCNFGDATITKVMFKKDGTVRKSRVLSKGEGLDCVDGLQMDQDGHLWTADFLGNAIGCICSKCGSTKVIAKNKPGTGADGSMDAPSECIRRSNKVYVANLDLTYGPNTSDDVHTISVFELP